MKNLENALGGKQEIKRNATAWDLRTKNAPEIDPETQPVLFKMQQLIEKAEAEKKS